MIHCALLFFFFNDTATTEIYTLSLHDALPISRLRSPDDPEGHARAHGQEVVDPGGVLVEDFNPGQWGHLLSPAAAPVGSAEDRKSTRLNSSHSQISYAVFCLKKKKRITSRLYR